MLLGLPLWVFVAFMASQYIVGGVLDLSLRLGLSPADFFSESVWRTIVAVVVYSLSIAVVIGGPYLIKRYTTSRETLGLQRLPLWSDIGLAPLAFIAYLILTTIVTSVVIASITGFPADQVQDVGFTAFGSRLDTLLAFVTLVVLAPIAEEVLFRGYLYGKLKGYVPTIVAATASSLLFAAVHFQWNVGVDVFVLSLVLCGLRSLTGSIWAGVLVHMIKNGLAYYILFINPLLGV